MATSNAKTAFMRGMKCNAALFIIFLVKKQQTIKRKKRSHKDRGLATCRRRKIDTMIAVELRTAGPVLQIDVWSHATACLHFNFVTRVYPWRLQSTHHSLPPPSWLVVDIQLLISQPFSITGLFDVSGGFPFLSSMIDLSISCLAFQQLADVQPGKVVSWCCGFFFARNNIVFLSYRRRNKGVGFIRLPVI